MASRFTLLIVATLGLLFLGLYRGPLSASPRAASHAVTADQRATWNSFRHDGRLIFIDSESDDEACDPDEDCSGDAKAAPKHDKKSDKKKKKAGTSGNSNNDCDPGEDCSDDAD